jgi:GAF domain-containing protein
MRELLQRLFPLEIYTNPIARRGAAATYISAGLILVGAVGYGLVVLLQGKLNLGLVPRGAVLIGVTLAALYLTRRGRNVLGASILLVGIFGVTYLLMLTNTGNLDVIFPTILFGISFAALLVGQETVPYTAGLSAIVFLITATLYPAVPAYAPDLLLVTYLPILVIHSVVNYGLAQGLRAVAGQAATSAEERRLKLTEASNTIVQRLLATRLDLGSLAKETIRLALEIFPDVAEAQFYLVDKERKNATLAATTYTRAELAPVRQIGVGSLSLIGRVTIGGRAMLVREGDEHAYRRAAFLPGTRAEVAVPLRVGNDTIGALDLHSKNAKAFGSDDLRIIETLTNQIAVVVDNARLYNEAQSQLTENQRLYDQARSSLIEIERLNQQLTGAAWSEYLGGQSTAPAFTIDLTTGQVEQAADWTSGMAEVGRRNEPLVRANGQSKSVTLPIPMRGQVIGAMEFEIALEQEVGPEQLAILQQVSERLGLALENARLLGAAQRTAQREAVANEIGTRMQATTSVEAVIAAATRNLADALQAPRVAVRLGVPIEGKIDMDNVGRSVSGGGGYAGRS